MRSRHPQRGGRRGRLAAREVARLLGPLRRRQREAAAWWRKASAQRHAEAMIELSRYAIAMARQTGMGKPASEMFPGFPAEREGPTQAKRL